MSASPYCSHCGALNPSEETTCFACGHSLADSSVATISPPGTIRVLRQRYRLLRQIGAGGFAAVYKAEDMQLGNRLVAVKEMSAHGLTPQEAQEATESFHREALLLARLSHPNLPRIYEQFEEAGHWYLVVDFIEGQTLEDYLEDRGGSLPVKEALQIGLQLTGVLSYLHSRQPPIVFRDLKPGNVMRAPDGQLFLIDFGIARLFKPGQVKDTMAFGSPGYAAPEQYGKTQTTPRSDVFSLGALLHHLLTGIDPSDTPFRFKPLTMPRPAGLSTLVLCMVDIDAAKRPDSMELVQRDLKRMLDDPAPWRTDSSYSSSMPAPGAYISPPTASLYAPQATTSAFPSVAPPSSVWQPPPTQGTTIVTPLPVRQKKKRGWVWPVIFAGILVWVFISGLIHNNTNADPNAADSVPVYALSWSKDGSEMAFGGEDGRIEIWDLDQSQPLNIDSGFDKINALAWSPDSTSLAVTGGAGGVRIFDSAGNVVAKYYVSTYAINALAWSPNGSKLALAMSDGTAEVVDATDGTFRASYKADSSALLAVAWSPDGKQIAFGGDDPEIQIWDGSTLKLVNTLHNDQTGVDVVAWSPDGKTLASGDQIGRLRLWDPKVDAPFFSYPIVNSNLKALAWAPDGQYLAANGNDYSVQVWYAVNHSLVFTYTHHQDTINAVAWSDNSQRVASASQDGSVQIWDAFNGENVQIEYLP